MKSDVYLHCTCPAFQYTGPAWHATENSYNLYVTEDRSPDIRDPGKDKYLCKHCIRVARYMSKMGFEKLYQRFKSKTSDLQTATIDDIEDGMVNFLSRNGVEPRVIRAALQSKTFMDDLADQTLYQNLGIYQLADLP